jgi:hypothetical protein
MVYGQIPTINLVGEYKFTNGSLNDTGGINHFTQTGAASTTSPDRLLTASNAVAINGDYLTGANIPASDLTISFWIKTTTIDANERTILDESERTSYYGSSNAFKQGWYIYLINGKVGFGGSYKHGESYPSTGTYLSAYTGFQQLVNTTVVADGFWHNIVVTAHHSASKTYTYKIYTDGVLENTLAVTRSSTPGYINVFAELVPAGVPLVVGNMSQPSQYPLLATQRYADVIDDIRIYNSILATNDIQELAKEDFCAKPTNMVASNLAHSSVDISWDVNAEVSNWELVYVPSGQPITNGTTNSTSSTSVSISGLSPATAYNVYVRSNCSNGIGITGYTNALTFTTSSTPIYVDSDATGANDGSTWSDAYTSLQSALAIATATRQIWVAEGTYIPHASNRKGTFSLLNGTKMYGGFNGTETTISQRDIKTHATVLSGDLQSNDSNTMLDTEASRSDNSYHVVTLKGTPQDVVVDGFIISGGNANGSTDLSCATAAVSQYYDIRGGAIYVNPYASTHAITALFRNCILEKNTGTNVAVFSTFSPCGVTNVSFDIDFESCIIRNNYSKDLTNMLYSGASGYTIYAKGSVSNSLFYNNTSNTNASCLYLGASTSNGGTTAGLNFDLINTTFSNNTGVNGNVITMINSGNSRIKNSIIYGNGSTTPFAITTSGSLVSNSIIEGGQQSGNDTDPLFADVANDNYKLQCVSPAIDAGNSVVTLPPTDLAGNARIANTLDMGPYEYSESFTEITALAKDLTIQLDASGNATLLPAAVNSGSGAVCGIAYTLSLDKTTFTCADLGANVVSLTATEDVSGAFSTAAAATVTIEDGLGPIAIAQNITVQLDVSGNATITPAQINNESTDNCTSEANLIFSLDKTAFICADLGENTVVLKVTDEAGIESTANATVTIEDTTAPTVIVQNVTMALEANGTVTIAPAAIDNGSLDNCTGAEELTFSLDQSSFGCDNVGTHTVTLTVTDISGNEATAAASVTIISSIADEMITIAESSLCPGGTSGTIVSTTSSMTGVTYSLRNSADNNILAGPISGTGQALNFSTGVINQTTTFNVYAESDALDSKGLDFDGIDDRISAPIDPSFDYQNGYTLETWVNGPLTSSTKHYPIFHVGTTTTSDIEVYLQNGTNKLIVVHNRRSSGVVTYSEFPTPPVNTWYHLSVSYDGSAIKVYYNGVAKIGTIGSTAGGPLTKTNGAVLNIGFIINSAAWVSTLRNFIGKMDEVRIWSVARTGAEILGDMNTCLNGKESDLVAYYNLDEGTGTTTTDIIGGFNGTLINMDGATDWVAGTQITCSSGCGFQMETEVTVMIADIDAPTAVAQDLTIQLDASGTALITAMEFNNGSTDQCGNTLTFELDKTNFTCDDLGSNTVTLSVTDGANNQATATAIVTVVDGIAPTAVTQNITVQLDASGNAVITTADINNGSTDNCTSLANLVLALDKTAFTCANAGANPVSLTVTDKSGNFSTAVATVTVVDAILPTALVQDITVQLDAAGDATMVAADIDNGSSDDCTVANSLVLSLDKTDFTCVNLGTNTVTLSVTDEAGNTSTATATVTVEDTILPTAIAQDINVRLDINNNATITAVEIDNGSSDNCSSLSFTLDKSTFNETNLGPNQIVLTVDDGNGNRATANATVTVLEYKTAQSISFFPLPDLTYGVEAKTLSATASSALSVNFAVIDGPAIVDGNNMTITGAGMVTIEATQGGDNTFLVADPVQQNFSVSKANLNVTADNQSIAYLDEIPSPTLSYIGFINGDDTTALSELPAITTSAGKQEGSTNAGSYDIILSGGNSANYELILTNGTLTINTITLAASANELTMVFGDEVPTLTFNYQGFVGNETSDVLSSEPAINTAATSSSDAGEYTITLSGGSAVNYSFNLINSTMTITKAIASMAISGLEQTADGTAKNVIATTTPADLSFIITYNGNANAPVNPGDYDVVVTINETNWKGTNEATFVILPAPLGISGSQYKSIEIYPTPAVNIITIKRTESDVASAVIYNVEGSELVRFDLKSNEQHLDVSEFPIGLYLIQILNSKSELIHRQKLLIKK